MIYCAWLQVDTFDYRWWIINYLVLHEIHIEISNVRIWDIETDDSDCEHHLAGVVESDVCGSWLERALPGFFPSYLIFIYGGDCVVGEEDWKYADHQERSYIVFVLVIAQELGEGEEIEESDKLKQIWFALHFG